MTGDLEPGAPAGPPAGAESATEPATSVERRDATVRRPLVERIGMAAIAAVLATLFGGVAAVSFASGEPFLGIMAAIGTLMTAWVGLLTLFRG